MSPCRRQQRQDCLQIGEFLDIQRRHQESLAHVTVEESGRAQGDGPGAQHGPRPPSYRAVSLPSLTVTVAEMIAALKRVAGDRPLGEITVAPDPFIEAIVKTWPQDAAYDRATALGLPREASLDEIVEAYIEDYLEG